MNQTRTVFVLLPVYNGARYLSQQIDSILAQQWAGNVKDVASVVILCRDDGSSDGSQAILADYALRFPGTVRLIDDEAGNLGAAGNFSALMHHAASETPGQAQAHSYFALADQDDIWHTDKLERSLVALLAIEGGDTQIPVLVHSDLRVVDASAHVIAESLMAYQGLRPARASLPAQLLSNTLTGCTAMMNRALIEKALPVPAAAVMHDWWLSLIASAFGRRVYLDQALADYRQHDSNTIGAKAYTSPVLTHEFISKLMMTTQSAETQKAFAEIAAQADAFVRRHGNEISALQRFVCRRIIALPNAGLWWQRGLFRLLRLL
ncbi:MAG: glycosyltransferase family 2 protein [Pseudohongiella sp.]|uniref:glycosyltransferase family 2 protein n=1 Tax=Pseudohongiella sp. TaxID=1979412 RepID=UPI0034A07392